MMASEKQFLDKVVLVTGASSGIGQAAAILFAKKGASVALCGQNQERLNIAIDQCKEVAGGSCARFLSIPGNLNDSDTRISTISKTVDYFGKIDVLIASAGISMPKNDIINCTEETFDAIFNSNVKSLFFIIQKALPHLEKSRGNIISVSSLASTFIPGSRAAYPMSKAAIDHMTRCIALDLAPKGIRVNAVNPSFIPTRFRRHYGENYEELARIASEKENPNHPLHGRCVTSEDVAEFITFLASDAAKFVTGQCHVIDGGRHYGGRFTPERNNQGN